MATNDSPAVILYSNQGNPVGVALDGIIYRLQVEAAGKVPDGYTISGAGNPVLIAGSDGYTVQTFRTDTKGNQSVVLTSPNAGSSQYASISAYGTLRTSGEPTTLLMDKFDGNTLDPITWGTDANLVAEGIAINGNLKIDIGTSPSAYSSVFSNYRFLHEGVAFLQMGFQIKFEENPGLNTHKFFGLGLPGDNTISNPLESGVGFEIDALGKFNAVIYSDNVKIFNYELTCPMDGYYHRYSFQWRTDLAFFFRPDGPFESPITTSLLNTPTNQKLPVRFHVINGETPPLIPSKLECTIVSLGDTARNNGTISDGNYQWQKLSVDATGAIPNQESGINNSAAPLRAIQIAAADSDGTLRHITANVEGAAALQVQDENSYSMLKSIYKELKILNFHLNQITDINLNKNEDFNE